jgi:hypothetical protein
MLKEPYIDQQIVTRKMIDLSKLSPGALVELRRPVVARFYARNAKDFEPDNSSSLSFAWMGKDERKISGLCVVTKSPYIKNTEIWNFKLPRLIMHVSSMESYANNRKNPSEQFRLVFNAALIPSGRINAFMTLLPFTRNTFDNPDLS